jgi:DNA polymerase I-like protein with 3'-5' exonuclease and polymerase domains
MIFLDTETTGLDPRADRLVLVGIAGRDGEVIVLEHDQDHDLIQRVLEAETLFVGHNVGFDMAVLEHACYRIPRASRWQDTQLLAHVAGERKPGMLQLRRLQLKLIEEGVLEEDALAPEDEIKQWLRRARREAKKQGLRRPKLGDAPKQLLEPYLKSDVISTRAVHTHFAGSINGQQQVLDLERRCLAAVYAAQERGVPLDLDAASELRERTAVLVEDLRARLFELAGHPFNVNSARQIERALEERGADISSIPRTPKAGLPMFTAQTLPEISDELADVLLVYREEKKLADYVAGLFRHTHGDRLYGSLAPRRAE